MLTTQVVAKRLNISDAHLRKLIGKGEIPATKIGRDWIINEADLDKTEYVKGKHREKKLDIYCQAILHQWMAKLPEDGGAWLNEMVDKLIAAGED